MSDLKDACREVRDGFKSRNMRKLRKAHDRIQRETALNFSHDTFMLAVYTYVLAKIVSKPRFFDREHADHITKIEQILSLLVAATTKKDANEFALLLDDLGGTIEELEMEDSRFVKSMVDKGKLKTAAILYAQGVSLSAASEMTGVEKQEIMDYAGKTMMFDRIEDKVPLDSRLKKARRMLLGDEQ